VVKCDLCEQEIDYLPFRCRYCGKQYCKKHRIPENHSCSFEFRNDPFAVKNKQLQTVQNNSFESSETERYIPSEERERYRAPRENKYSERRAPAMPSLFALPKLKATFAIIIVNIIMYVLVSFPVLSNYLYISVEDFTLSTPLFYTLITSIFIPSDPGFVGIINLIFTAIIIFFIGRTIEQQYGAKKVVEIYFLGGLFTSGMIVILQFLFGQVPIWSDLLHVKEIYASGFYSSWGGIVALVAYMSKLLPNIQVNMLLFFIPIRLKMKNIVWIFVGFDVVFGTLNLVLGSIGFVQDYATIFGVLGGFLMFKMLSRPVKIADYNPY
jgi:membrane associated rhomboid family serine protease